MNWLTKLIYQSENRPKRYILSIVLNFIIIALLLAILFYPFIGLQVDKNKIEKVSIIKAIELQIQGLQVIIGAQNAILNKK